MKYRPEIRGDLELIAGMVGANCRVLDVGCGDGALLGYLGEVRQQQQSNDCCKAKSESSKQKSSVKSEPEMDEFRDLNSDLRKLTDMAKSMENIMRR